MPEANGAYLTEHSPAMTHRQLLAAAILLRYREPAVAPPFPPTCMPVPSVAPRSNIRNDTQKKKH
jgi:hypothetical protein